MSVILNCLPGDVISRSDKILGLLGRLPGLAIFATDVALSLNLGLLTILGV